MLKLGKFGKAAGTPASDAAYRHRQRKHLRLLKTQGRTIPWNHAAIYGALVVAAALIVAWWDHAYEARRAALFAPPPPQTMAQQLVERGVVGPGNVSNVTWDDKTGALAMTVRDILIKPGQARDAQRRNAAAEGVLAVRAIQGGFAGAQRTPPKSITVYVTTANGLVATTSTAPGQHAPTTEFSGALK